MAPPAKQRTAPFHVVAVPYPGRGHINPMLSLCKSIAAKRTDITVTVVVTEEWRGLIDDKPPPNMSFAAIPNFLPSERERGGDIKSFFMSVLMEMGEPFERLLDERRLAPSDLIVADALLDWAAQAAGRRNIPVAHLWCMSAAMYSLFYHFDLLVHNGHFPVDLSDTQLKCV